MNKPKRWVKKQISFEIIILLLISFVILAVYFTFECYITKGQIGTPLDDLYIHFQFSKNIAEGNGFSYNAGVPTPGSTSPAWTLVLTVFYIITGNHLIVAKLLSAVFFVISGVLTYLVAYKILQSKKWAFLAGVFTLSTGRFAWSALSGMEVTFFTTLLLLFILLYLKNCNRYLLSSLLGLSSTVRPEGYLIFAFFIILESIRSFKSYQVNRSVGQLIIQLFAPLIISVFIYIAIISPYIIFTYKTTGRIFPNTFSAQARVGLPILAKLRLFGRYYLSYGYLIFIDNPLIFAVFPLGFLNFAKENIKKNFKYIILLTIALGFPVVASIFAPNLRHHGRYIMPFVPVYMLIGVCGIKEIFHKYKILRSIKWFVVSGIFLYLACMLIVWGDTYGWNVKNINDVQIHLGKWIEKNLPREAIIAVNDIGAIKYYSQREIIDLIGLVDPEILKITHGDYKNTQEDLWDYVISARKPTHFIIYPCWFPEISMKSELREVYGVEPDKYTIIDCEMVVYEVENDLK